MFFLISKIFSFLLYPVNLLISLALIGWVASWIPYFRGFGFVITGVGLVCLAVVGITSIPALIALPLENRFPAFADDGSPVAGIVVLGGAEEPEISAARQQLTVNDSAERDIAFGDLSRRYPNAKLFFAGGSGKLQGREFTEAGVVARYAEVLGLVASRVLVDDRSRNTYENALFAAQSLKPTQEGKWLLVTSAVHMPRAIGCFRNAGFLVTAYPVDFHTKGTETLAEFHATMATNLRLLDIGVREWLGLVIYRINGYTSEFFPSVD